MNLNNVHIQELYKFTRQHFVEHYDLQTELVDHLANDIEAIWKERPTLSFYEAKQEAFKKFGVFGFMDIVEQKHKQMTKRYWKILWRFMKTWFTIPKIIITLTLLAGYYTLLRFDEAPFILGVAFLSLSAFLLICQVIIKYKTRLKKKRNERIFLLEEMIHNSKSWFVLLTLLNLYNLFELIDVAFSELAFYWVFLMAVFFTLLTIAFYIVEFVIPDRSKELLEETYPEYKLFQ